MKELMIDYLEGNLTGELKEFVAKHVEKNNKWKNSKGFIHERHTAHCRR